ncbi:hypothetical protein Q6348_10045 [Isoptericola sp. b441]|uniref:Lipoprotein n=1 Tax=Actinotalea lenta TaxID=3064654 RepID=A0ABT9D9E8_9CELL|nr:hypothetical protein [Isoptericola sp. b441]MDO8107534.1 hypothetical protein [Isoptericola sp. b441]
MNRRAHGAAGLLIAAAASLPAACASQGDLEIDNVSGESGVHVDTGDEQVDVPAAGGVTLLDYGCTPGDVTVRFASGDEVVLRGPVCPDQRIVIRHGTATLHPASSGGP